MFSPKIESLTVPEYSIKCFYFKFFVVFNTNKCYYGQKYGDDMEKLKDKLNKCKNFVVCGALGLSSVFLVSDNKQPSPETAKKQETIKKHENLIRNYSMIEAFSYGLCNSIGDQIRKADYRTDPITINKKAIEQGTSILSGISLPVLPDSILKEFPEAIPESNTPKKKNPSHVFGGYYSGVATVKLNFFKADTISEPNLSAEMKKRIVNFVKTYNDSIRLQSCVTHEFTHKARNPSKNNAKKIRKLGIVIREKGLYDYNVLPEEDAKLNNHDEIGANISSLLRQREIFKETGDLSAFYPEFSEYVKAVENGQINPFATNKIDKAKERFFIAKTVTDYWKKASLRSYEKAAIMKMYVLAEGGKYRKKNSIMNFSFEWQNAEPTATSPEYKNALNNAYTFIMDNELVNMNYISDGGIEDVKVTRIMEAHAKSIKVKIKEATEKPLCPPYRYDGKPKFR